MDANVQWKVSDDVETIVAAITSCKRQLIECVKKRRPYKRNLKTIQCEAFASPKLVQLLQLSDVWRASSETVEEQDKRYPYYRYHTSKLVADFEQFKLHEDEIVGDASIRVMMAFDCGEDDIESFVGNVEIVT